MRFFDWLILTALGALAYNHERLNAKVNKMDATTQDVLREVGETVSSSNELLASVQALVSSKPEGDTLTQDEANQITASLQTVQDNNAAAKASIDAVLNGTTGTGDTGTGNTGDGSTPSTGATTDEGNETF